jgi:hypothetical protein
MLHPPWPAVRSSGWHLHLETGPAIIVTRLWQRSWRWLIVTQENGLTLQTFRIVDFFAECRAGVPGCRRAGVQGAWFRGAPGHGWRSGMFYLLWTLGLVSTASGVFVIVFSIPIRDTTFGSALLVAGSVAIAGGFVTVGLAVAVAELRRVIQALKARMPAVPRPLKPAERKDAVERKNGENQPGLPRNRFPPRPAIGMQPPAPPEPPGSPMPPLAANREPPAAQPVGGRVLAPQEAARGGRPEWLRRAFAELSTAPEPPERPTPPAPAGPPPLGPPEPSAPHRNDLRTRDGWPHLSKPPPPANFSPAPDIAADDPLRPQTSARPKIFDTAGPSARGRPAGEETPPEKAPPEPRPAPPMTPSPAAGRPPAPASPPRPNLPPPRSPSILKSGVIDEMAYTLFTDGSIEAQLPEGTTRFASIEELREHLEKREG